MTPTQQIKAIAELDGWTEIKWSGPMAMSAWQGLRQHSTGKFPGLVPNYLHSRDAIVPVIEKQSHDVIEKFLDIAWDRFSESVNHNILFCSPSQLCEALLRATGRWIE